MNELKKATTVICGQRVILTGFNVCKTVDCNQDFCQTMLATVFSKQWGLTFQLVGAQRELHSTLLSGIGYAVSDGSYKDAKGAAAWIIEGRTSNLRLTGQWHVPSQEEDHSSFHSKLAGIVGVLYTLTFWPPKSIKPPF